MLELNFIKFMKSFSDVPVYSFYIPEDAPSKAYCFENAGQGVATQYHDGSEIITRTIKLTLSTDNIADIYNDSELTKYVNGATSVGDITLLKARVLSFHDLFNQEQKIYERTYSIQFKYKV
ncbi:hypothetical protein KGV31_002168 [Vibrio parahaemolyticus]|nr:hypothetical protein [Vibrio parahaemolyticus]EHU0344311.1 hypothetical protein [Vibrio parahaemolyticus]EHU0354345.1 hypothetical protein [Vibrio parahaemolyticus]